MEPRRAGRCSARHLAMQDLSLQPHVGFGLVASRPIFLDLKRDRYIALEPRSERDFIALSNGELISSVARDRLVATGLFRLAEQSQPILPAAIPLADGSLLDEQRARPSLSLALRAYASTARARRRLGREPLLAILDDVPASARRDASSSTDAMLALSRKFLAARSLVPIPPKCLPDSLALRDWLGRAGLRPKLIFAVRLDPFGAHCWLQSGTLVLNDSADAVAAFTPVLVLS